MGMNILDKFSEKKVMVIGDMMIDKYVYGDTTRISPEAPVPIVNITREKDVLGGAGNVANNLSALSAKVYVAGVLGDDKEAITMKKQFKDKGIDFSMILEGNSRPTIVKKRVISGNNYQLIRLDYEVTSEISKEQQKKLVFEVKKNIKDMDAIIFSDYSKGLLTEHVIKELMAETKKHKKITIVDTKPKHLEYFRGCTLITPNLKEAIGMTGIEHNIIQIGEKLVKNVDCNVFITRGAEGISVFDTEGKHTHVPQIEITKIFDVTGAGDTVVAAATLAMCSGYSLVDSARIANLAAGIVIQKPGTSFVTLEELKKHVH